MNQFLCWNRAGAAPTLTTLTRLDTIQRIDQIEHSRNDETPAEYPLVLY